ncbi:hypothetical protein ACHAQJ_010464 [Trichoderma viride]
MAHAPEHEPHKRKRDVDDDGGQPAHLHQSIGHHEPTSQHSSLPALSPTSDSFINFLPRHHYAHLLGLLPGDVDTFGDIIYLVSEYEGVLDRSESLAASLGAKLTGPRFLRGIERFFDGPIKTNSPHPYMHSITWLDVVTFAKTNPDAFSLVSMANGTRCCQFMYHGLQVEITEDDWRLISSGALDKFPLEHIFEEDEAAELATLEILLQRSSVLYKKADEVSARARLLHQRLDMRRRDVARQRQSHDNGATATASTSFSSGSGSGSGSGFFAINNPPRASIPGHDLHAELLHQFTMASAQNLPPPGPPPGYHQQPTFGTSLPAIATGLSPLPLAPPSLLEAPPYQPLPVITYPKMAETTTATGTATTATVATTVATTTPSASTLASILAPAPASPSPPPSMSVSTPTEMSLPPAPATTPVPTPTPAPAPRSKSKAKSGAKGSRRAVPPHDPASEVHRSLVLQKADTVNKGDVIFPPCDRCRRLRLQCVKHLSACRGCTRKHARCNWKNVTDEEAEIVKHQLEIIEREAEKAREEAATASGLGLTQPSEANSGSSTSHPDANSSTAANLTSPVEMVSRPASASESTPAPTSGPAVETPLKLVPTSRLTRIEPAPTVQRNPPRTGQLAAILSPPDYEPRPFHTLPSLAPR